MTPSATENHVTTDLYWEATGSGPAVLLVPGTPGDGGQMEALANDLAADHLVVTYDRRGTSRSPAPAGWAETSLAEQADDAAAVLAGVGLSSALVYGTSNGAAVALELALRHPTRVSRAILHEMPLLTVVADPSPVISAMSSIIGDAMASGGPPAALDAFLRFAFGDAVVDGLPEGLRERMLANAAMVFTVELPAFQAYRPDPSDLAACEVPVDVLVGEDQQAPFLAEAAGWLAERLRTTIERSPDAHGPHLTAPARLAACIRALDANGHR